MKQRLGQVGPGRDENQWSHTANSAASACITGNWSGRKALMTAAGSPLAPLLARSPASREAKPELVMAGEPPPAGGAGARQDRLAARGRRRTRGRGRSGG